MQKLLFLSILTLSFGIFFLSCENSVNPSELPEQNTLLLKQSTLEPQCTTEPKCITCDTYTPGYWKNHPELWPVEEITIGINIDKLRTYTKDEAIMWLKKPVKGDKTITMFKALVAAVLNSKLENCYFPCCIKSAIAAAHGWLEYYPVGDGVAASSEAWQYSHGEGIYWTLDHFNNTGECIYYY